MSDKKIVLCRFCKFYHYVPAFDEYLCIKDEGMVAPDPDDFCSRGEINENYRDQQPGL